MPEWMHEALHVVVRGLEIVGASALILGFLIATVRFVGHVKTLGVADAREGYRRSLGRVVLVGLEILVAATIIKTITIEPTPASLGLLAMMIAVRTFLGWTMVLEMDGRWPWQAKRPAEAPAKGNTPS